MKHIAYLLFLLPFYLFGASELNKIDTTLIGLNGTEKFGWSIAMNGNFAVVGAPDFENVTSAPNGAAFIFQKDASNNWTFIKKLKDEDEFDSSIDFGHSVAIHGDYIVVGDPNYTISESQQGRIWIYEKNSGGANNWGQIRTHDGFAGSDNLGYDVSVTNSPSGIRIAASSLNGKRVVMYDLTNEIHSITGTSSEFGSSIDLYSDLLAVGDPISGTGGEVSFYRQDTTSVETWNFLAKTVSPNGVSSDKFGSSLDFDGTGTKLIVGASGLGKAYILDKNVGGTDKWGVTNPTAGFEPSDKKSGFGHAVGLFGTNAIVTTYTNDSGYGFGINHGGTNQWGEVKLFNGTSTSPGTNFGHSLTIDGSLFLIGQPQSNIVYTFIVCHELKYSSGANGSVDINSHFVNDGATSPSVTATPNTGYDFQNWTNSGGSEISTSNPLSFTNVTNSESYTANFSLKQYTLNYAAGTGGSINPSTDQTVNHGASSSTVTATPNTGYTFQNWTDSSNNVISTQAALTVTNVTKAETYTANFALKQYTLSYSASTGGSINPSTDQTVNHGANSSTVTATVSTTGYQFENWTDSSNNVISTQAALTITNVTKNETYTANFGLITYTLNFNAGTGGSVDPNAPQTINYGTNSTTVTATADTGYTFQNWTDSSNNVISSQAALTVSNVTNSETYTANFTLNSYTLNFNAASGGTIAPNSSQNVNHGASSSTVTATPNTGYSFQNWTDPSNNVISTQAALTVTNVTNSETYTANFTLNSYTLNFNAASGGTVAPNSPQNVNHGASSSTVTATPNTGYSFQNWTDSSNNVISTQAALTVTNVTNSETYTANFITSTSSSFLVPTGIYHAYNMSTLDHYFTPDENEYNNLNSNWIKNGIRFYAYSNSFSTSDAETVPVHKFINPANNHHFWTTDENEKTNLTGQGWTYLGIQFHMLSTNFSSSRPWVRLYHPYGNGRYVWTEDQYEIDTSILYGWSNLKTEGYIIPISEYDLFLSYAQSSNPSPPEEQDNLLFSRYRLYNPNSGHHHWTTDSNEYDYLGTIGWNQEDSDHKLYLSPILIGLDSSSDYFRLYNPNSGEHHWTTNSAENSALATYGWVQEGTDGQIFTNAVDGSIPLYRLYNPNSGFHHYTTNLEEYNMLFSLGWNQEGISGHVFP